jgi:hypothetical protein
MEEILSQAFSTGDIKIVAAAVILYVIIYFQRKDTGKKRDTDHDDLQTKVTLLENDVKRIRDLDLETKLAQIQTDLQWIKENLKK